MQQAPLTGIFRVRGLTGHRSEVWPVVDRTTQASRTSLEHEIVCIELK